MKKNILCAALSLLITAAGFSKEIIVTEGGLTLSKAIAQAKSGDTIIIDGTISSNTISLSKNNITIKGINDATIDFSSTLSGVNKNLLEAAIRDVETGDHIKLVNQKSEGMKALRSKLDKCRGFTITGNDNIFESLVIKNAADNGIFVSGSHNTFKKVQSRILCDC